MSPTVRIFLLGFMLGVSSALGFINYYGDLGGTWLIEMGQKMKTAAETRVENGKTTQQARY
jgi:hypothetical protein